ncbi:MAG: NADPH-dependent FMN reductase [Cyanobium sp.]
MSCDLLVITASNGENLKLAERFAALARQRGLQSDLLDLTTLTLPLFTARRKAAEGIPPGIAAVSSQLAQAPRWVICTPEYNGSIPPLLTNTIAWLSVADADFRLLFNGRPVAIATHSGSGGTTVLTALRLQLAHLGAQVIGRQLVANNQRPAADETIADLLARLAQLQPLLL